jgi:hypothetical protein
VRFGARARQSQLRGLAIAGYGQRAYPLDDGHWALLLFSVCELRPVIKRWAEPSSSELPISRTRFWDFGRSAEDTNRQSAVFTGPPTGQPRNRT